MRAADTNVVLRIVVHDDPKQATVAQRFVASGVWVSLLVLAETIWVLATGYGRDRAEQARVIETLLGHRSVTLEGAESVAAALELFRQSSTVSFSDCLIVEIARRAGHLPLGTFDRRLARLDGTERL